MPDSPKNPWNNQYFALRHAESTANEQGIILARPENGTTGYGLTKLGQDQITAVSGKDCENVGLDLKKTICYSSDFTRALETAVIFCTNHSLNEPVVDVRLRERSFGDLEFESNNRYQEVWAFDNNSLDHTEFDSESLRQVSSRIDALVSELEQKLTGKHIVLCSHGDTLQITQCVFKQISPTQHRNLPHLGNAELRILNP